MTKTPRHSEPSPDTFVDTMGTPDWLKPYMARLQNGEITQREIDDPERESDYDDRPVATAPPERFSALAQEIGIGRYARELREIEAGKLPDNTLFKAFRKKWLERTHARDGAIIFGGEGTGKSVIATWACRKTVQDGQPFDFIDAIEIAQIIGSGNWTRYKLMASTGLVVVDECGDIDDIRGTPFAYLKLMINRRYRGDLPTILCSTALEDEFKKKWGAEIYDRLPIRIGSGESSSRLSEEEMPHEHT